MPKTVKPENSNTDKLSALISSLNKKLGGEKGRAVIQRGSNIKWSSAKRITTGSLGLDRALNGGVPRGQVVQFMGEESSGKTTMALKVCATLQKRLKQNARIGWIAVEPFDKHWANQVGVQIAFSKDELRVMRERDRQRYQEVKTVGEFVVASAISGEDALQIAYEMVLSGIFHLVVVDSIAALQPLAEVEKEMDEKTMGQLPRLVGLFLKKCYSAFNSELESGEPNETAVILINQVREKIGSYMAFEPEPPGGRALRHAVGATVRFKKGEILRAKKDGKDEENSKGRPVGRRTKVKVEKSKIGPPYREAEFDFYFDEENDFEPGDIDTFQELRIWGVRTGLIEMTGNTTYVFAKRKFKGKAALESFLTSNPVVADDLRRAILRAETTADVE